MTSGTRSPSIGQGSAERLAYLRQVISLLWPECAELRLSEPWCRTSPRGKDMLLLPGKRRPRLLVPAAPKVAAAAIRHYGEQLSAKARAKNRLLSTAAGAGAVQLTARDIIRVQDGPGETIQTHLSACLGREVLIGLHLGPPRANRKPVLQLLTPAGNTLGFAKIGINELTNDLVCRESSALNTAAAAGYNGVLLPDVLHAGQWNGLEILVLAALPVWRPRAKRAAAVIGAMVEVATRAGLTSGSLGASTYWQSLEQRLEQCGETMARERLREALTQLKVQQGETPMMFGAWHGDWTPWNMAVLEDQILLWDWERFGSPVPLGQDALHYALQTMLVQEGRSLVEALDILQRLAPELLGSFAVATSAVPATIACYLADLCLRYLRDGQSSAGGLGGDIADWLLPALEHALVPIP